VHIEENTNYMIVKTGSLMLIVSNLMVSLSNLAVSKYLKPPFANP